MSATPPTVCIDTELFPPDMVQEVQKLIDDGESSGAIVSAWEDIQKILLCHKVAWQSQIPPDFVGVHPCNRSKLGVGGSEAHNHGHEVLKMGF